jgi:hypothetical protein
VVNTVRQYDNSLQYKSLGLSGQSVGVNEETSSVGGEISVTTVCSACEGSTECKGRQPVETQQVRGLCTKECSVGPGVGGVSSSDRVRLVCVSNQSETSGVLFGFSQRQQMFGAGRLYDSMGSVEGGISSSADPTGFAVPKESSERRSGGVVGGPVLDGSTLDPDSYEDDSEDENSGRVILSFKPRATDAEEPGQASPRSDGGLSGGQKNDPGEELVLKLIDHAGLSDYADWFFESVASTTFRNYRRGFTLFSRLLQEDQIDPLMIIDVQMAVSVLVRVLNIAFRKNLKLSAVLVMKTAVVRLFEFMFSEDLGNVSILKMAIKYYTTACAPKKEDLKLEWSVEKLFEYFMTLPQWGEMEFNMLMRCALVLCMCFSAMRFTEILAMKMSDTDPDGKNGVWKFWSHTKGHVGLEPVYLQDADEPHLSPVAALVELRNRIRQLKKDAVSFWYKLVDGQLVLLSYNELRSSALEVLIAAGIKDKRPYHIKHAVLTYLDKNGVSAQGIAAFARHKFGSMMAFKHYISYDGGKSSSQILLNAVKEKKN